MPEYPDLELYVDALRRTLGGRTLEGVRIASPALLRSVEPSPVEAEGRRLVGVERLAKRVVWVLEDELYLVFHLMVTGRFHWRKPGARPARRGGLAAFDFAHGTLLLTEAGTRRRASLHLVRGRAGLADHDPGGAEVFALAPAEFAAILRRENHTLKRALSDPRLFAAIGNAYSDEILHRARLSPLALTSRLDDDEIARLHAATLETLREWRERLLAETGAAFPEKVTAFRPEMAVHGRHRLPCPACGAPIQRIVYAENETDYCPGCQTGGRILADRALSRLLKQDWPRTLEELEQRRPGLRPDESARKPS